MSTAIEPGACAPSTSTGTPRAWHAAAIAATGKHQRGLRGDVVDDDELGARRERARERVDDVAGVAQRIRHLDGAQRRARSRATTPAASATAP